MAIILIEIILSIYFCVKGFNSFFDRIKILTKLDLNNDIKNTTNNINNININNIQNVTQKINKANKKQSIKGNKTKKSRLSNYQINKRKLKKNNPPQKKNSILNMKKRAKSQNINSQMTTKKQIVKPKCNFFDQKIERNDYEMNSLDYKDALKYDQRTFGQYYLSLLRMKHLLIFTFYTKTEYNSRIIKLITFFTTFGLYYTIKALFFNDFVFHIIYLNRGVYDFIY